MINQRYASIKQLYKAGIERVEGRDHSVQERYNTIPYTVDIHTTSRPLEPLFDL